MAEKGPESGKRSAAMGFAEAPPEKKRREKSKTDATTKLVFFMSASLLMSGL
jgi:hypothetical protein